MQDLLHDARLALRTLRKSPVFTTVAVLSLVLGIGANTAVFSLMDQVLYRMLPVKHPERLVFSPQQPGPTQGSVWIDEAYSYPMYRDFRDRCPAFNGVMARFPMRMSVSYRGQTDRAEGELVSGNYFEVLGVRPFTGRTFTQDDDRTPGAHPLAFLSYGYWQRRFGGDVSILNQVVLINGRPLAVIGIGPPGFNVVEVGRAADVMVPIMMKAQMTPTWDQMENRRAWWVNIFARLKPGVSLQQANAAVNVLYHQINTEEIKEIQAWSQPARDHFVNQHLDLLPGGTGQSGLRKDFQTPLTVLMCMVGLVLLIACANLASLLIARAAGRQKEMAVRVALGAGRWRIIRQLAVESLVLAIAGGLAGLLMASWAGDFMLRWVPDAATRGFTTSPEFRTLSFNFAISLVAGLLFGLVPAIRAARPDLAAILKDQALNVAGGSAQVRFRKLLVATQIALSLLLLVGSGLFARSLYNLKNIDPGFRARNLITFSLDPSLNGYSQQRTQQLYARLLEDIGTLPGVQAVSAADVAPLSGDIDMSTITVEGHPAKEGKDMNPNVNHIGPGYFATLGTPLIAGREFTNRDMVGAPKVGLINETAAHYFFGNENAIGKHYGFGGRRGIADIEIIGVVKDDKSAGLKKATPRFVYAPVMQS